MPVTRNSKSPIINHGEQGRLFFDTMIVVDPSAFVQRLTKAGIADVHVDVLKPFAFRGTDTPCRTWITTGCRKVERHQLVRVESEQSQDGPALNREITALNPEVVALRPNPPKKARL
jgi:hypothetical protein